ncbi:hypothetical protein FACS1894105_04560 [Clostridia bacterium]|nr:hypothetical protein FACS1894105_04560 [Clostridia bacterium]
MAAKDYLSGSHEESLQFKPRHYICPRAPFELDTADGNLDKPFWQNAPFSEEFLDIEWDAKPKPYHRTRMKMQWDDKYLYIGAMLEENQIWATVTERDATIYVDPDFEVFIDPDGDTHNYYELEINALNTLWDLLLLKPYRDGGPFIVGWDIRGVKTGVRIMGKLNDPASVNENKGWSVELALPWRILGECAGKRTPPQQGDYWRIDFSRVEWRTEIRDGKFQKVVNPETGRPYGEDNWIWSPIGAVDMHRPEFWGFLVFADNAQESFTIPQVEYTKWTLRRLYYRERIYFSQHGRYCADWTELTGGNTEGVSPQIAVTPTLFEASLPNPDGSGQVVIFNDGKVIVK